MHMTRLRLGLASNASRLHGRSGQPGPVGPDVARDLKTFRPSIGTSLRNAQAGTNLAVQK